MLTLNTFSGVKLAPPAAACFDPRLFLLQRRKGPVRRLGEVLDYPVKNKHVLQGLPFSRSWRFT